MRIVTFEIGERVGYVNEKHISEVTIKRIYPEMSLPIVIVEDGDGNIIKTSVDKLVKIDNIRQECSKESVAFETIDKMSDAFRDTILDLIDAEKITCADATRFTDLFFKISKKCILDLKNEISQKSGD